MAVRVRCPNPQCRKRYKVDESLLGHSTVCKACGQQFTLNALARETLQPDAQAETLRPDGPAPATAADVPNRLGRFEIRARIGSGAFGTVYWAHDPVLDRDVALKVPRAAVLEKPEARARFLREPKAAAQLRHPNIVPVYDAGTDGEHYYIASAYIEGRTLEHVIAEDRPDFRRAAEIVRDLASAVHYAHGTGVIHRDVKPANIMIDERGQALLMDFGLARLESAEEKLTQDGSLMGTPAYMAPEQADASFGEVGPASDQYALGVVLYELLCGEPPFSGPPAVLIYNLTHQAPPPPRRVNADVPRDLDTIALKAMSKPPGARYADCGAMADDLRRWLADAPIAARPLGPMERLGRWCRRNPRVAVLSTLTVVLLVLVAVVASVGFIQTTRALARARDASRQAEQARDRERSLRREAESLRQETQDALARERKQRELADAEREHRKKTQEDLIAEQKEATAARSHADAAKEEATLAREEATRTREQSRTERYRSVIAEAYQWFLDRGSTPYEMLNECPRDLRHWEWQYLMALGDTRPDGWNPRDLGSHSRLITSLAFSRDGRRLASASLDQTVYLWDLDKALPDPDSETERGILRVPDIGPGVCVMRMAFSPDNTQLALLDTSGGVSVWNTQTGERLSEVQLAEWQYSAEDGGKPAFHGLGGVRSPRMAFDGRRVTIADPVLDGGLIGFRHQLFDAFTGKTIPTSVDGREHAQSHRFNARPTVFRVPSSATAHAALSHDGKRLVSVDTHGEETNISIRDPSDGYAFLTLKAQAARIIEFSPDNTRVAMAMDGQSPTAREIVRVFRGPGGRNVVRVSPTAPETRSARTRRGPGERNVVRVWTAVHPRLVCCFPGHGPLAFSPDARHLLCGSGHIMELGKAHPERTIPYSPAGERGHLAVGFGRDGKTAWTVFRDDTRRYQLRANIWDWTTGEIVESVQIPGGLKLPGQITQDAGFAAILTGPDQISLWDRTANRLLGSVRLPSNSLTTAIAVSRDGKWIAARQEKSHVWHEMREVVAPPFPRGVQAFSDDGSRLVRVGEGKITIWDTAKWKDILTLDLPSSSVYCHCLALGQKGTRLAVGDNQGISVWNLSTGKRELGFSAAPGEQVTLVTSVAFSPDGKWLAAAAEARRPSEDGREWVSIRKWVSIWDVHTDTESEALSEENPDSEDDSDVLETGPEQSTMFAPIAACKLCVRSHRLPLLRSQALPFLPALARRFACPLQIEAQT